MSYTKQTLEHFSESINSIFEETTSDNDLTLILERLNTIIEIGEQFSSKDRDLEFYWNEIISDLISVIHCGISGQYRLAISGLRNILELACSAFYYYDHKIELHLYVKENFKADKYVSSIISEYHFFKTNYIRAFNSRIDLIQVKDDSISSYLSLTYAKLCDVVHGRFKSLTKTEKLTVEYSKDQFKRFETSCFCTLSAIAILYVIRFDDFSNKEIYNLAKISKTLKDI